jgi:hypothetical protein
MIALRAFTKDGIRRFEEYIDGMRIDPHAVRPNLNIDPYSSEFHQHVELDEKKEFATRMEMADYLYECLSNAGVERKSVVGVGTEGLWTWLAYLWFEQITDQGNRVLRGERYLCSSNWNRYYVHLIAGAYYLFSSALGRDESRLFLCSPPYTLNDFNDHMACYQYIVGYRNIVDVAHRLYWDNRNGSPKRGAESIRNPGNIRRFSKVISQLELTYDVYSMEPDRILQLLPSEFDNWRKV